jgi:apolipoprotein N-acyltransferase
VNTTLALALVNWLGQWWMHLDHGDRGTWFGGIVTALTLIAAIGTALYQGRQGLKLREAEQDAAITR